MRSHPRVAIASCSHRGLIYFAKHSPHTSEKLLRGRAENQQQRGSLRWRWRADNDHLGAAEFRPRESKAHDSLVAELILINGQRLPPIEEPRPKHERQPRHPRQASRLYRTFLVIGQLLAQEQNLGC